MNLSREMTRLDATLDQLLELIPRASTVALVDEPVHRNVGDHLIQRGSDAFFVRHQIRVVFRASTLSYSTCRARATIPPEAIIVCQGGGHLGDIYTHHQRLREKVIRDFPSHRVVVLPQSIHFRDPAAERLAIDAFGSHGNLDLCLRDRVSFDRAASWACCPVRLIPDMAHALWPLYGRERDQEQRLLTLYLIRNDQERAEVPETFRSNSAEFVDWTNLLGLHDSALVAVIAVGLAGTRHWGEPPLLRKAFKWQIERLIRRAISLMVPYRLVVTSRLHGALLALLLGKRLKMLDSLTGKSSAYHATWLAGISDCQLVDG